MANREQELDHLVQGLQHTNPRVYEVLRRLIDQVSAISRELDPLVQQSQIKAVGVSTIPPPIDATIDFTPTSIHITWTAADPSSRFYEIRLGTNWDTANFITITPTTEVHLVPVPGQTLTFLIKAIDIDNNRSAGTTVVTGQPALPAITPFEAEIIDNNVFLRWQIPISSFDIRHYEIYKGNTLLGYREGTFTQFFEQTGGSYTYGIVAVDIAGNRGPKSELTVHVNPPPDYILTAFFRSDLLGEKFHVKAYFDPTIVE